MSELEIKTKLLEEIKAHLEEQRANIQEGWKVLENAKIFKRDAEECFLDQMEKLNFTVNEINRFLYPLYWERDGKITKT